MSNQNCILNFTVYSLTTEIGTFKFQFSGINFDYKLQINGKIYNNYQTFKNEQNIENMFIQAIINNEEQLSSLQIYLWQNKQRQFFEEDIKIIIKQELFEYNREGNYLMPLYWRQISTLAVQMGYDVNSLSLDQYPIESVQIKRGSSNYDIFVFSDYIQFETNILKQIEDDKDTIKFDFDQIFNQKNENENQKKEFYDQLKNLTYQILLQRLALNFKQNKYYCGLLPQVMAWNAYQIIQGKNGIAKNVDQSNSQQSSQLPLNCFVLPVHLLQYQWFKREENNYFIFQQLCDVSYIFKAEFFAIYSYFKKFDNTVLSQSSRSGKTVTLHTVFYFHQLLGLKIPIYFNLGFDQTQDGVQVLYNRTSVNISSNIASLYQNFYFQFDAAQNKTQLLIQRQILDYYDYDLQMDKVLISVCSSIEYYSSEDYRSKIASFHEALNKITSTNILSLCNLDLFQIDSKTKSEKDNIAQKNNTPTIQSDNTYKHKVLLMVDECLQLQKEKYALLKKIAQQLTDFYYHKFIGMRKDYMKKISASLQQFETKYLENIFGKFRQFSDLIKQKQIFFNRILKKYDQGQSNSDFTYLENLLESYILEEKTEDSVFQNIKLNDIFRSELKSQVKFLKQYKATLQSYERYFIMTFSNQQQQSLIQSDIQYLIDEICILSPNFKNIKLKTSFQQYFYYKLQQLNEGHCQIQFKQNLYNFIMTLFNPRCMETIFWRNLFQIIKAKDNEEKLVYKQTINQKLLKYLETDNTIYFKNYLLKHVSDQKKVELFFKQPPDVEITKKIDQTTNIANLEVDKIKFNQSKYIEKQEIIDQNKTVNKGPTDVEMAQIVQTIYTADLVNKIKIDYIGILVAGTDMSLINFIRQQQGINSSYDSADLNQYILSDVIGGSQIHPSYIDIDYYFQCKINMQAYNQMKRQIKNKSIKCDIINFYLSVIPELSAEIQFQCPLICPQLQILYRINDIKYVKYFNNTNQFIYKNNNQEIILLQNQSYQSLIQSFFIEKVRNTEEQLMNGQLSQNIIQQSSNTYSLYGKPFIQNCCLQDFYTNLKIATSSNINRTSVYIYYYIISQRFVDSGLQNYDNKMMLLYFTRPQLSELSGALQFLVQLTQNEEKLDLCKKFIEDIDLQQFIYSIYTKDSTSINHTLNLKDVLGSISQICQNIKFIIFLQTFDYQQLSNIDKQEFVIQAVNAAVNCYATILKYLQTEEQTTQKKFIIMMKIDVPYLTNLNLTETSIPDFILFFFGFEDHFQDLSKISSPIEYTYNNQLHVVFILAFESGVHCEGKLYQKISGSMLDFVIQASYKHKVRQIEIDKFEYKRKVIKIYDSTEQKDVQISKEYQNEEDQKLKSLVKNRFDNFALKSSLSNQNQVICSYKINEIKNSLYFNNIQFEIAENQDQEKLNVQNDQYEKLFFPEDEKVAQKIYVNIVLNKIKVNIRTEEKSNQIRFINNQDQFISLKLFIENTKNTSQINTIDIPTDIQKYLVNLNRLNNIIYSDKLQNLLSLVCYSKFSSLQQQLDYVLQQEEQQDQEFKITIVQEVQLIFLKHKQIFQLSKTEELLQKLNNFNYVILDIKVLNKVSYVMVARIDFKDIDTALQIYVRNKQNSINFESVLSQSQLQDEILNQIDEIMLRYSNQDNQIEIKIKDDNKPIFFVNSVDYYQVLQQFNQNNIIILEINHNFIVGQQISNAFISKEEYYIKQWIKQSYQGEQIENYLKKYNYIDFNRLVLNDKDLKLFQDKITVTKLISDLIDLGTENEVYIQLYDSTLKKLHQPIAYALNIGSIIDALTGYVFVKYEFFDDVNIIKFTVVSVSQPTDQQQSISIVEEPSKTQLEAITFWFSNYFEKNRGPLTPEVENYIKSFKAGNLTEEIAESANLELFDTEMTVEMQIQKIFEKSKNIQKDGLIKIELSNDDSQPKFYEYSVDTMMNIFEKNIIIAFVFAGKKLILICLE